MSTPQDQDWIDRAFMKAEKIAGFFFDQYRTTVSPRLGSRVLNFYGRLFIGHPEKLGLDNTLPDIQRTFFQLSEDRWLPGKNQPDLHQQAKENNILCDTLRHQGARHVALTYGLMAMVLTFSMGLAGAFIYTGVGGVKSTIAKAKSEVASVKQKWNATPEEKEAMDNAGGRTREDCLSEVTGFYRDQTNMSQDQVTEANKVIKTCEDAYDGVQDEARESAKQTP